MLQPQTDPAAGSLVRFDEHGVFELSDPSILDLVAGGAPPGINSGCPGMNEQCLNINNACGSDVACSGISVGSQEVVTVEPTANGGARLRVAGREIAWLLMGC